MRQALLLYPLAHSGLFSGPRATRAANWEVSQVYGYFLSGRETFIIGSEVYGSHSDDFLGASLQHFTPKLSVAGVSPTL